MNVQQTLENDIVLLKPLQTNDFEELYAVASDPLIWEQHPNKDRYKREVFQNFFEGAILSKGAYLIIEKSTLKITGCTRFYDYDENTKSIFIGYTFYGREFWGSKLNPMVKKLMMDYIFNYVETVKFHIGKENIRSIKAMDKLGGIATKEIEVAYFGESPKINIEFEIEKQNWISI